jgi:hypothetical protein
LKKYISCVLFFVSFACIKSQNLIYDIKLGMNTMHYFNSSPKINGKSTEILRVTPWGAPRNESKNRRAGVECSVLHKLKDKSLASGIFLGYQVNDVLYNNYLVNINNSKFQFQDHTFSISKYDIGPKVTFSKYNFNLSTKVGLAYFINEGEGIINDVDQFFLHSDLSKVALKPVIGYCYGIELNYEIKIYKKFYINIGAEYNKNLGNKIVTDYFNMSYPIYIFYTGFKIKENVFEK